MLSVCIPVYNSDVSVLVDSLVCQLNELEYQIEICLIDDASTHPVCDVLSFIHPKIIGFKNTVNAGRAGVRNQFKEIANYPYLLFLDGDSRLIRTNFLKCYCDILSNSNVEVLCGASVYQAQKPARAHYLRWKYSTSRESKSLDERKQNPNLGFKSNNFIIQREIFNKVYFNESLKGYGHEDTLFGYDLKKANIKIEHVDNPVLNHQLDDNITFLQKSKEGVTNLLNVLEILDYDREFLKSSKLARTYISIKNRKLGWLISLGISFIHPFNLFLLKRGFFVLPMFDLYKLKCILSTGGYKKALPKTK
ncbi:MAG: glycosyltransferase family 2 protein [Crocinitomicaceae bacterium]